MNIDGWTYFAIKRGPSTSYEFEITSDRQIEIPKTLFKYYSNSDYSIRGLINNEIFASHPNQFNDLFDCYEDLIEFDKQTIKTFLLNEYYESEEKFEKHWDTDPISLQRFTQRNMKEIFFRKVGLLCMTPDVKNTLMWAYYSNNQGFALEFDYSKFPFKFHGPFPINYVKQIRTVKTADYGVPLSHLYQSNVKSHNWKHENEMRILIQAEDGDLESPMFEQLKKMGGNSRVYKYPNEALKSITLGNRFFEPEQLRILDNQKLQINLENEKSDSHRFSILNYVTDRELTVRMILRKGDFETLSYKDHAIEKMGDTTYTLYSI